MNGDFLFGAKEVIAYLFHEHKIRVSTRTFYAWIDIVPLPHVKKGRHVQCQMVASKLIVDMWFGFLKQNHKTLFPRVKRSHLYKALSHCHETI